MEEYAEPIGSVSVRDRMVAVIFPVFWVVMVVEVPDQRFGRVVQVVSACECACRQADLLAGEVDLRVVVDVAAELSSRENLTGCNAGGGPWSREVGRLSSALQCREVGPDLGDVQSLGPGRGVVDDFAIGI